jgi:uncharacterized lipoprotein NlpE involved in copper resistance
MKKSITFILITVFALTSYAQRGSKKGAIQRAGVTKVEVAQVPDAVKNAFTVQATDTRWEKHEATGKAGKAHVKYVAIYTQDGIRTRSRFKEDGSAMSSSKYMGAEKLPTAIQTAATTKNPGAKLVGGEELTLKTGQVYYRVRLRNGSSKINSLFDASGNEVTKDKMTEELKETDGDDGK